MLMHLKQFFKIHLKWFFKIQISRSDFSDSGKGNLVWGLGTFHVYDITSDYDAVYLIEHILRNWFLNLIWFLKPILNATLLLVFEETNQQNNLGAS